MRISTKSLTSKEILVEKAKYAKEKLIKFRKACDVHVNRGLLMTSGGEGLAVQYSLAKVDKDGDGSITDKEYENYLKSIDDAVSKASDFLTTSGIIGALFLSFLYPQLLQLHLQVSPLLSLEKTVLLCLYTFTILF